MIRFVYLPLAFLCLTACSSGDKKPLDTPTSGSITITVDETFKPLIEAQLDVFHTLYPKTAIKALYKPEAEAIVDLLNDSARLTIAARELDTAEFNHIKNQKITSHSIRIAVDGIALIVNKNNPDSVLQVEQVLDMLRNKLTGWNQISKNNSLQTITLVFDNKNSSTVRYLKEKAGVTDIAGSNVFALQNNSAVIEYVQKNKNALGIIGVNWISDSDDSLSNSFKNNISIVALSKTKGAESFKPYQAYLSDGSYPFTRGVYMISREARTGLGSGFISFVASDKGQRIVQKTGLMPVTMPVRFVELSSENINY